MEEIVSLQDKQEVIPPVLFFIQESKTAAEIEKEEENKRVYEDWLANTEHILTKTGAK